MTTIWETLGIEPTTDEREIRRAYAKELKRQRPDNDPEGFQVLREAFDSAKRYASSASILPENQTISSERIEQTPMVEYVQQLMMQKGMLPEETWSRDVLRHKAQVMATLLTENELKGLEELHRYIDNEISDALEARQVFSVMLAEALSTQNMLTHSLLNEVSAVMDWQVENYRSSQLPAQVMHNLEQQIFNTQQEEHWQYLAREYSSSNLGKLKWRLLTDNGAQIPWWSRLIPDFIQQLSAQVREIRQQYPTLEERLNPILLESLYRPGLAIRWETIITILFWGYTAWLTGHASADMAIKSGLLLIVIAAFIWCYPPLIFHLEAGSKASKCVHAFFWLASMLIIAGALYRTWQGIEAWQGIDILTERGVMIVIFIVIPILWSAWERRSDWHNLPLRVVTAAIMFPIMFIRQLSIILGLIALFLVPKLYALLINMIYFVQ